MLSTSELILQLSRSLYPSGRAWLMKDGGDFSALHKGLAESEAKAWEDARSILDSLLPDNPRFTEDDATDWERRLGLTTQVGTSLEDRKAAIRQKIQSPGKNPARSNYLYIQQQLQLAGFNVWVHENLIPTYPSGFISVAPNSLYGNSTLKRTRHGQFNHGQVNHGLYYTNKVVNSIYPEEDVGFNLGGSFRASFFIGGQVLGTFASVPAARQTELRRKILTLKPVQNVAFLFINYT